MIKRKVRKLFRERRRKGSRKDILKEKRKWGKPWKSKGRGTLP
jgi:hypothetical protein